MTNKLKLAIIADCRHQLNLAGHCVADGKHVEARDIVAGTVAALQTFEGLSSLPPAIQDAQEAPGEPSAEQLDLLGWVISSWAILAVLAAPRKCTTIRHFPLTPPPPPQRNRGQSGIMAYGLPWAGVLTHCLPSYDPVWGGPLACPGPRCLYPLLAPPPPSLAQGGPFVSCPGCRSWA